MDYEVLVEQKELMDVLYYNNEKVLTYTIYYPQFESNQFPEAMNQLNSDAEAKALLYEQYVVNKLYQMAVDQYETAITHNYPFRVFDVFMEYMVTFNQDCAISYYFDQYEYTGGAHGRTFRFSTNWDLQKNEKIFLEDMFSDTINYREYILNAVKEQIENQINKSEKLYFAYYYILIGNTFNENNFFLIPEGVVLFYQEYAIAPYASGILTFVIPYSNGTVIHPSCQ